MTEKPPDPKDPVDDVVPLAMVYTLASKPGEVFVQAEGDPIDIIGHLNRGAELVRFQSMTRLIQAARSPIITAPSIGGLRPPHRR